MQISEFADTSRDFRLASGYWNASAIADEKIGRFLSQWQVLADARGSLPARRDFDPTSVPELLPNLLLVEIQAGCSGMGLCRQVRLAGTRIVAAMGAEITGVDLASLPREDGARALTAGVDMCLSQRRPVSGEFGIIAGPASRMARVSRIAGFRFLAAPFLANCAVPTVSIVLVVFVAADGSEVWAEWLSASATA